MGDADAVSQFHAPRREYLLRLLSAATFLIFFQAFMVAPLLPRLAEVFGTSVQRIGLTLPAYLIPYGIATLAYGPLSDRFGRGRVIVGSLIAFVVLTALTTTAWSVSSLIWLRLVTGLGASGIVPIALALVGDLFPFPERGRPLGCCVARWPAGWRSDRRRAPCWSRSSPGEACSSPFLVSGSSRLACCGRVDRF